MALSRILNKANGATSNISDITTDLDQIYGSALALVSPLTGTLQAGGNDITGLDELVFNNAGAVASGTGALRRNAANLSWHDGTTTRNVIFDTATQTLTNKTLTAPVVSSLALDDTDSAFNLTVDSTSTLTAARTLTIDVEDGARTLTLAGNFGTSGSNNVVLTTTGATNVTLPTTGTLATLAGTETLSAKTLTTPTIAATGWTNANHAHTAGNSGGTLDMAAIATGTLGTARGGTNADTSASSGVVTVNAGTWTFNNVLTAGRVLYAATGNTIASDSGLTYDGSILTLADAGPALKLTNSDSQIFVGLTTDPGWSVAALHLGQRGSFSSTAADTINLSVNEYFDGTSKRVTDGLATRISNEITTGSIYLQTAATGLAGAAITFVSILIASAGVQCGAPTGGDKGLGSLNLAADAYKNNSAYNNPDYVLEHWASGEIVKFADREGAAEYRGLRSLAEIEAHSRLHYTLPLIYEARQRERDNGGLGLFAGSDAVLASVEEAYLHLFDHERRLQRLEALCA